MTFSRRTLLTIVLFAGVLSIGPFIAPSPTSTW